MKNYIRFLIPLLVLWCSSCRDFRNYLKEEPDETSGDTNQVVFDTSFPGARLTNIEQVGENQYRGNVSPSFEPVNDSPWFAFAVSAPMKKQIKIELDYGSYDHRYIPKLSRDKTRWESIEDSMIEVDTVNNTATLTLDLTSQKLYVAAQEIESSEETYNWMDSLLARTEGLEKKIAGRTVLKNPNYVLLYENEDVENAIVLIARQHPPEVPGGTIGFKSFSETVFSNSKMAKKFRKNFNVYVFPLLNPDGADFGNWRHNANGKDLNRDWINFSQPETQAVKRFIEGKMNEGKKVRFALDFHTSYSGPYLLILDSINEAKTNKIIPEWIRNIEKTTNFKVNPRRRSQELPYSYNYFFNNLAAEAVTYEEGDEIDREIIKRRAKVYAEELMKVLIEKEAKGDFRE